MPSRTLASVLAPCVVVALALVLAAAGDERELAFTHNVRPTHGVVEMAPGGEACQWGIEAAAEFDVVEPLIGTHGRPGPPLALAVRELGSGRVLARGRIPGGARDNRLVRGRVAPPVAEGRAVGVCFRNEGAAPVVFYGGPSGEAPGHAFAGMHAGAGDMRLAFYRGEPRSALASVPDMFRRAALFRPEPVGAWTFWLLLVLVGAGVPLLLARALRATRT